MRNAFSLIELIVVVAILAATGALALPICKILDLHTATRTFNQIQDVFAYARSLAIADRNIVTVCPSFDRINCSYNWSHGILIIRNNTRRYVALRLDQSWNLRLIQSGQANHVEIQPNGMTYTNGHFILKSLKASVRPQHNLYFNKALRFYVAVGN